MITPCEAAFHMCILRPNRTYIFKTSEITFYLLLQSNSHNSGSLIVRVFYKPENRWQQGLQLAECLQSWEEFFYQTLYKGRNKALGPGSPCFSRCCFQLQQVFIQKQLLHVQQCLRDHIQDPAILYKWEAWFRVTAETQCTAFVWENDRTVLFSPHQQLYGSWWYNMQNMRWS